MAISSQSTDPHLRRRNDALSLASELARTRNELRQTGRTLRAWGKDLAPVTARSEDLIILGQELEQLTELVGKAIEKLTTIARLL